MKEIISNIVIGTIEFFEFFCKNWFFIINDSSTSFIAGTMIQKLALIISLFSEKSNSVKSLRLFSYEISSKKTTFHVTALPLKRYQDYSMKQLGNYSLNLFFWYCLIIECENLSNISFSSGSPLLNISSNRVHRLK